jgi:hypothetical protein
VSSPANAPRSLVIAADVARRFVVRRHLLRSSNRAASASRGATGAAAPTI